LAEALLATGIVGRPEEYFRPDWYLEFISNPSMEYRHKLDFWRRVSDIKVAALNFPEMSSYEEFLSAVLRMGTTRNGVFAVKIHWHQLVRLLRILQFLNGSGEKATAEVLNRWFPNPRYVFLRRWDKVRQAISLYRANRTEDWWSTKARRRHDGLQPVDFDEIERFRRQLIEHEEGWQSFFTEIGVQPFQIIYEEFIQRPRDAVTSLMKHLCVAVPSCWPEPKLRRQADAVTDELVNSYLVRRRSGLLAQRQSQRPMNLHGNKMRTSIIVAENFYANAAAIREYALKQEYYFPYESNEDVRSGRRRFTWMASRFRPADECPFKSSQELIRILEELTGERIDIDHWRADFPVNHDGKPATNHRDAVDRSCLWNCSFHCKPENGQQLGDGVHNHVTDSWNGVGINGWSGVIYLNLIGDAPLSGGLKLWKNHDPERDFEWMSSKENWELVDDIGNVPNRLILCRGDLPHSGAAGWGDSLESGRLYQTFFFRTLVPVNRHAVSIFLSEKATSLRRSTIPLTA